MSRTTAREAHIAQYGRIYCQGHPIRRHGGSDDKPQPPGRKLASPPTPADTRGSRPPSRRIIRGDGLPRSDGEDDQELCGALPSVWRDSAGHKKVENSSTGTRLAGKGRGSDEYELEKPRPKSVDGREIELPRFCMPRLDDSNDPAMVANRYILDSTRRKHGSVTWIVLFFV